MRKFKPIKYISFFMAILFICSVFSSVTFSSDDEQRLKDNISQKQSEYENAKGIREDYSLNFYSTRLHLSDLSEINAEISSMNNMKGKFERLQTKYEKEIENIKKILVFAYENKDSSILSQYVDSNGQITVDGLVRAMLGHNNEALEDILAFDEEIAQTSKKFADAPDGISAKIAKIETYITYLNNEKDALEAIGTAELALQEYYHYSDTFLWPLSLEKGNIRITSVFGNREIFGAAENHEGIDIAGPTPNVINGDDIYAAADGVVVSIRNSEKVSDESWTYGYYVLIYHEALGLYTIYGHASAIHVKKGQTVKKGDVIAKVGNTGRSTAPHLHFEVRKYSGAYGSSFTRLDPLSYFKNHTSNK